MTEYKPDFPLHLPMDDWSRTEVAKIMDAIITPDNLLGNLRRLQEPAAPSGTEILTRTPLLKEMLLEVGVRQGNFEPNFLSTESAAVWLNRRRRVLANFQLDDISYLPRARSADQTIPLRANGAHRQLRNQAFDGAVVRYNARGNIYEYVSTGQIVTDDEANPYYKASVRPRHGFDPVTDRIVYKPEFSFDPESGLVSGRIDGPASVAVAVSAASAILKITEQIGLPEANFGMVFAGEEEGLPVDNTMFSRGARLIASNLPTGLVPEMVLIVDGHDVDQLPPTAMWGEQISDGKGKILSPHHAVPFRDFLKRIEKYGVRSANTWEVGGTLSRSDDVGWMGRVKNIIPYGYAGTDFHFVRGVTTTNINSLVNLAKGLAWIALSARN